MKISPIRPTIKQNVMQKMKSKMGYVGMALYALNYVIHDTYMRIKEPYYMIVDGKKVHERDLPNYVSRHDEWTNAKWGKIIFSPEDEEKMKYMTMDEKGNYMSTLIRQNKYTLSEPK